MDLSPNYLNSRATLVLHSSPFRARKMLTVAPPGTEARGLVQTICGPSWDSPVDRSAFLFRMRDPGNWQKWQSVTHRRLWDPSKHSSWSCELVGLWLSSCRPNSAQLCKVTPSPSRTGRGYCGHWITSQLPPFPNPASFLSLPQLSIQQWSLISILHANLHLRVSFPRNKPTTIINS